MSEERSMREELEDLARRLAEREAELAGLERTMDRLEGEDRVRGLPAVAADGGDEGGEPALPAIVLKTPEPIVSRDPAVIELLRQSEGAARRFDHLRVSLENLDRKVDALARELLERRDRDDAERRRAEVAAAERRGRLLRLLLMIAVLLVVALAWALAA